MNVVRYEDAPPYEAPGHAGMAMRRLQGREAGPADTVWLGCSVIAPGGGTSLAASDVEKFYVVLEGEVEVTSELPDGRRRTETLRARDSCRIAPLEARRLRNASTLPATVLLVMPKV
jgi:hypothetical protein